MDEKGNVGGKERKQTSTGRLGTCRYLPRLKRHMHTSCVAGQNSVSNNILTTCSNKQKLLHSSLTGVAWSRGLVRPDPNTAESVAIYLTVAICQHLSESRNLKLATVVQLRNELS